MQIKKNKVISLIKLWIPSYEEGSQEHALALFADSPHSFHYGTGPDEIIEGKSGMRLQLARDFAQSIERKHGLDSYVLKLTIVWFQYIDTTD